MKKVIIIIASAISIVVLFVFASYFFLHSAFETFFPYSVVHTGTSGEYAEKTEKLLEEKYGEKFKVIRYGNNRATVYPEANPDLLFMAERFSKSNHVDDTYIQEIVGLQYKKLAEEVLKDFKYDYYLDVDFEFTYDPIDAKQDVTIEEFKKVFPEELEPAYNLYVSDEALELSYENLYEWINRVATIPEQDNSLVCVFFIDDLGKIEVKKNYENYSYPSPAFYDYLMHNTVRPQQHMVDKQLKIDFNRFTELMNREYLKNELYR